MRTQNALSLLAEEAELHRRQAEHARRLAARTPEEEAYWELTRHAAELDQRARALDIQVALMKSGKRPPGGDGEGKRRTLPSGPSVGEG